jgi:membrane-bound lytic murein transglycosylase B
VIKTYNRSNAYALGVAFLSDQIDGQSAPDLKWPEHEKPLMRSEISELQRLLTVKGCNTQGTDGIVGPNTEKAIRKFQKQNNLIQDGFHSISFFKILRS